MSFLPALAGRENLRNSSLSPYKGRLQYIIKYARKRASAVAKHPDALAKQGRAEAKHPDAEAKHPQAERKLLIFRRLTSL